jgi:hypothetical protein
MVGLQRKRSTMKKLGLGTVLLLAAMALLIFSVEVSMWRCQYFMILVIVIVMWWCNTCIMDSVNSMRRYMLGSYVGAYKGVMYAAQTEGSLSFQQGSWLHNYEDGSPLQHEAERLPPPAVPSEDKLQVNF